MSLDGAPHDTLARAPRHHPFQNNDNPWPVAVGILYGWMSLRRGSCVPVVWNGLTGRPATRGGLQALARDDSSRSARQRTE